MLQPLSSRLTSWLPSIKTKYYGFFSAAVATLAIAVFSFSSQAAAAQDEPACKEFDWPVNRELELFHDPDMEMVFSGATLATLPEKGIVLELQPQVTVDYELAPEREPKAEDGFGGLFSVLNVAQAGSYQVTTSSDAWIDIVQNGRPLALNAETTRTGCAAVRKSMRFNLEPGRLTVQVSGANSLLIRLAILPAE